MPKLNVNIEPFDAAKEARERKLTCIYQLVSGALLVIGLVNAYFQWI